MKVSFVTYGGQALLTVPVIAVPRAGDSLSLNGVIYTVGFVGHEIETSLSTEGEAVATHAIIITVLSAKEFDEVFRGRVPKEGSDE